MGVSFLAFMWPLLSLLHDESEKFGLPEEFEEGLLQAEPEAVLLERWFNVAYARSALFDAIFKADSHDSLGILAILADRLVYWETGRAYDDPTFVLAADSLRVEWVTGQPGDWLGGPWVSVSHGPTCRYFQGRPASDDGERMTTHSLLLALRDAYGPEVVKGAPETAR